MWFEFSLQNAKLWMENTDLGNQDIRVCILMKKSFEINQLH